MNKAISLFFAGASLCTAIAFATISSPDPSPFIDATATQAAAYTAHG